MEHNTFFDGTEDLLSEITALANAVKVLVDDMSTEMPLQDQHRLLAIYYLADSQLKLAEIIADQLRSSPDML